MPSLAQSLHADVHFAVFLTALFFVPLLVPSRPATHAAVAEDYEQEFVTGDATFEIEVDATRALRPFQQHWTECVGSGHASLMLRADYREQLERAHRECGFRTVRAHGLLCEDMSAYFVSALFNKPHMSFANILNNYDWLLSIGMKPFVELSFIPLAMARGPRTMFHYRGGIEPPSDFNEWGRLIESLARVLVERYGIDEVSQWYFEVYNEPNLDFAWTGTQAEYWQLYAYAANALKRVSPRLQVGGPATSNLMWIDDFARFLDEHPDVPRPSFISSHIYPTDLHPMLRPQAMLESVLVAQKQTKQHKAPFILGEVNVGLYERFGPAPLNFPIYDRPVTAAWIVKTMHDLQGAINSTIYWTFSDIFEEEGFQSTPFFKLQGWGLLSLHGVAKPAYRAFQLLHWSGDTEVHVAPAHNPAKAGPNCYATTNATTLILYCSNYGYLNSSLPSTIVRAVVSGVDASASATLYRIDDEHCNAPGRWLEQGSPIYPSREQVEELHRASELRPKKVRPTGVDGRAAQFSFHLPAYGVAVLVMPRAT